MLQLPISGSCAATTVGDATGALVGEPIEATLVQAVARARMPAATAPHPPVAWARSHSTRDVSRLKPMRGSVGTPHAPPTLGHELERQLTGGDWDLKQRIVLTCRMLAAEGHSAGLAGQITARADDGTFWTAPLGLLFEEVTVRDLVRIDDELGVVEGTRMANPAARFHLWIYRARPNVNCIVHTHPLHVSALSMIGRRLVVSHMDTTPFFDDCAYLADWPGVPVADLEGRIISDALGDKRAILLAHHGQIAVAPTVEEAAVLALWIDHAARLQLLAEAAGEIQPIPDDLAREAHDFMLNSSVVRASFAAYARRVLRANPSCLD
jgi:L-fuculose-phosphate aldolase